MTAARIDHEEVQRLMDRGAQVLDALPPSDYRKQHLPGAINVPLEEFSADLIRDLDRNLATITYCADNQCDLSARLAARLVLEGFSEVYEYAASLADWGAYGHPLEGETENIARSGDLARKDFPTCSPDDAIADVASRLGDQTICVVLDKDGAVVGRIAKDDLDSRDVGVARDVMHPGPSTFRPDVHLDEMADWFKKRPQIDAFIITTPDGHPVGVLYRSDTEAAAKRATERQTAGAGKRL